MNKYLIKALVVESGVIEVASFEILADSADEALAQVHECKDVLSVVGCERKSQVGDI